jgi:hypothetical protein
MNETVTNEQPTFTEGKEQWRVKGEQLVEKVRELIHEGNVRRLIIKHEGHTVVEIPVTIGVIGAILSPTLAAVSAIGVLLTDCTVEVVRLEEPPQAS